MGWPPHPTDEVLEEKGNSNTDTKKKHRERNSARRLYKEEAEMGWAARSQAMPRIAPATRSWERQGRSLPSGFRGNLALPIP